MPAFCRFSLPVKHLPGLAQSVQKFTKMAGIWRQSIQPAQEQTPTFDSMAMTARHKLSCSAAAPLGLLALAPTAMASPITTQLTIRAVPVGDDNVVSQVTNATAVNGFSAVGRPDTVAHAVGPVLGDVLRPVLGRGHGNFAVAVLA